MTGGDPGLGAAVDVDPLIDHLRRTLPDPPSSVVVTGFASTGSSNITAFLDADDRRWVLRRAPLGELRPTAHDMLREFRFLQALQDSAVRVPRTVLACEDPSVLGVPFYIAERVDGVALQGGVPSGFRDPAEVGALVLDAVDALAAVHAVDWRGRDLPGRPGQYLERQVHRWCDQLAR